MTMPLIAIWSSFASMSITLGGIYLLEKPSSFAWLNQLLQLQISRPNPWPDFLLIVEIPQSRGLFARLCHLSQSVTRFSQPTVLYDTTHQIKTLGIDQLLSFGQALQPTRLHEFLKCAL